MPLIIQKYGGTSVSDLSRIEKIADKVIKTYQSGIQTVVVLSAMGEDTDRLHHLAYQASAGQPPCPREYDALVSTGELTAVALMSIILRRKGYPAYSYTGRQAGILTCSQHKKARIIDIAKDKLTTTLKKGGIPVVAGFQGVDASDNITTLGRGGSDITAVGLAVALKADECQIYTDVDGVYTTDPNIVKEARLLDRITFEEMLELSSLGAKVLQIRSVELAGKHNIPLRVLPSFKTGNGTLITYEKKSMEKPIVSGIAYDANQAKLTFSLPNRQDSLNHLFQLFSKAQIMIDMIVQSATSKSTFDISFTIPRNEYKEALTFIKNMPSTLEAKLIDQQEKVGKLSIVGVGMHSHVGVATTLFNALAKEGIPILLVSTSEIKISVLIEEKYLELGTRVLHSAFNLDNPKRT